MRRFGTVIGLDPSLVDTYRQLHADVWPAVLAQIARSNIRNYSIYLREPPENLLFAYFEYHGVDFDADMALMAADPDTQQWWALCGPCQVPLPLRRPGEHWATLLEVFHMD